MPPASRSQIAIAVSLAVLASATTAQPVQSLDKVEVTGHYGNAIGTSDAASAGVINSQLIEDRPLLRPGQLLEYVPGLVVTQHSGAGKANQYFLRGFNLDHGTDFATSVNGIPINLRTHGHGQGYTDLNFVITELVDRVNYFKGPYYANVGDFGFGGRRRHVLHRGIETKHCARSTRQLRSARAARSITHGRAGHADLRS